MNVSSAPDNVSRAHNTSAVRAGTKLAIWLYSICCLLAIVGWYVPCLWFITVLPMLVIVRTMKTSLVCGAVFVVTWVGYDSTLFYVAVLKPLNCILGVPIPPWSFITVVSYTPVFFATGLLPVPRKGFKKMLFHLSWDAPLLISMWVCRNVFNDRLILPFISHIGDTGLIVGSMPLAVDVAELKKEGVTHVVNMCAEYSGPVSAYDVFGIRQLHLPTVDMTQPSESSLRHGVQFIHNALYPDGDTKRSPTNKVFVHCKGGQGRAPTMAAAYLIVCRRMTAREAVDYLQNYRNVVSDAVAKYRVLRAIESSLPLQKGEK